MTQALTRFMPDSNRLAVIQECMDNYMVGADDAEWPNNIISRKAVVYGNGVIARRGIRLKHAVDPDELARCRHLADAARDVMAGAEVGMGSASSDPFREFFIAANSGDPVPARIDADLIRAKFGDTLFPPVTISVEPLAESGTWWSEVLHDARDHKKSERERYLQPWRAMIRWFHDTPELSGPVFVRIGDSEALLAVPQEDYPAGTETTGCVLPRMAVGLSANGSLIGIFGYSVQA